MGDTFLISSWYLEPATANDRGPKQAFPERAYIIAGDSDVDIIDADTNKLWMRFDQNTDYALGVDANNNPSAVHMLNGRLYVSTNGSAATGLYEIIFGEDAIYRYDATAKYKFTGKGIDDRNTDPGTGYHSDTYNTTLPIVNATANDTHAAVVCTGNSSDGDDTRAGRCVTPKMYSVVSTDSGLSVIHETGTPAVYDYSDTANDDYNQVWLTTGGELYGTNEALAQLEKWNNVHADTADEAGGTPDKIWDDGTTNIPSIASTTVTINTTADSLYITEKTSTTDNSSDTLYLAHNLGLAVIQDKAGDESNGSVKYYTASYISEEMIGDITDMDPMNGSGETSVNTTLTGFDASVKANAWTTTGSGTTPNYISGVRGTALEFDGGDQVCTGTTGTCADDNDFDYSTAISIGAWVKSTGTATTQVITRKLVGATEDKNIALTSGKASFNLYNVMGGSGLVGNRTINDDQWHHVVGTYDGSNAYLYVDGQLDNSKSASGDIADSTGAVYIGNSTAASTAFTGQIDEVFWTAETLSASQVKRMYEVGKRALEGSHGVNDFKNNLDEGGDSAGATSEVRAVGVQSSTTPGVGGTFTPGVNSPQFAFVAVEDDGTANDGYINKVDLNSDTSVQTFTATTDPPVSDDDTTTLSVSPSDLEIAGADGIGAMNPGLTAQGNDTSGVFQSSTVTIPENISSAYLWVNNYRDSSDGGSTLTVEASNNGGTSYATCSNTNNDTNQTPTEYEYVCRFAAADNDLKVRFTLARTDTDPNNYITQYGIGWSAAGADIAENYVTDEADLRIGDLVRIKQGGVDTLVGKTLKAYDDALIGVVSTRPGLTLGPEDGSTPGYQDNLVTTSDGPTSSDQMTTSDSYSVAVALGGRVPVKIVSNSAIIRKGDYLTASSLPGLAMKSTKAGKVIGQALEDCRDNSLSLGGINSGGNIEEKNGDSQNSTSEVKEQQSHVSLVETHSFTPLTSLNASDQKTTDTTTPESTTANEGLSSAGTKNGTTNEPKNTNPNPTQTSDNLSNWESVNNTTINTNSSTTNQMQSTNPSPAPTGTGCTKDRILVFINPGYFAGLVTADGFISLPQDNNELAQKQLEQIKILFDSYDSVLSETETAPSGVLASLAEFFNGLTQNTSLDILEAILVKAQGIQVDLLKAREGIFSTASVSGELRASTIVADKLILPGVDSTSSVYTESSRSASLASRLSEIESVLGEATSSSSPDSSFYLPSFLDSPAAESSSSSEMTMSDSLALDGNLLVTGLTSLSQLSISGLTTIGTLTLDPSNSSLNSLSEPLRLQDLRLQPIEIFGGIITLNPDGDIHTQGEFTASKLNITHTTGQDIMLKGNHSIYIKNDQTTPEPKIFLTPRTVIPATLSVTSIDPHQGFLVQSSAPLPQDTPIDWWIIN